jgi:hypothetical protein
VKSRNLGVAWALCGLALLLSSAGVFAASGDNGNASTRKPRTVPYWSSSFTNNGVTYPFTMVGSDPRLEQSTTVDTMIVPLSFEFVASAQNVSSLNATMNGADNVADAIASPIFTPTDFSGDSGVQFGDAFARAQFGKVGTGYHVILGQPRVADTVTIQVPDTDGVAVLNPAGVLVGRVDSTWFRGQLAALIDDMNLKPTTLPIFLTNNVVLYSGVHCCTYGSHGAGSPASDAPISLAGKDKIRTFVYAAYLTPNSFFTPPYIGLSDINSLSHEIAEWIDNPFGINVVPPYPIPGAPPGFCSADLETGDVLSGVWFSVPGNPNPAAGLVWHPQDEVFLNWFARNGEDPGLAPAPVRYTFAGAETLGGRYAAFGDIALACLPAP